MSVHQALGWMQTGHAEARSPGGESKLVSSRQHDEKAKLLSDRGPRDKLHRHWKWGVPRREADSIQHSASQ